MTTHHFLITPRDLLFMRDARPMAASDAGKGGHWPRPDQVYYSLINAFHWIWPEHQTWEHNHRKRERDHQESSDRFGGLKTAGPFPVDTKTGQLYLPCPLDLSSDENKNLYPMKINTTKWTNLPKPLTYAFTSSKLGKHPLPRWISTENYNRYLNGEEFKPGESDLYDTERNVGIGINQGTHSTVEGQFYQAEYLRFRHETRLAIAASCEVNTYETTGILYTDVFEQLAIDQHISWMKDEALQLLMGGQQGVVGIYKQSLPFIFPESVIDKNRYRYLRWTLISPAVFPAIQENSMKGVSAHPGGWLPTWVDPESGNVMLPLRALERQPHEDREAWRDRIKDTQKFSAKLIAARVERPIAFSGWDLQTSPKPTVLAVPAGSSYVFECKDAEELVALANALSWNGGAGGEIKNRRSGIFGEKGYGLGVCSTVSIS